MKACTPHSTRIQRGWELAWSNEGGIFYMNAMKLGCLSTDLKKLRWAEKLRVIQLYYFLGTSREATVEEKGSKIPLNQWVFDKVTEVVPSCRIKPISVPRCFPQNENLVIFEPVNDVYKNYYTDQIEVCTNLTTNTYRLYQHVPGNPAQRII